MPKSVVEPTPGRGIAGADDAPAEGLIDESEDRVHVFSLRGACQGKVVAMGTAELPKDPEFLVI